ncbi:exported hypothetical protein [Candidatus Terasakiella magnetica]|uniref:Solute-binding protein family 3/N-terminal domain-containing protein n=1 Tax=Candidatus Terasakiella magnetica TaxID=1867952 RepID=A0A1C3RJE5_9PROT|nr:transporter substrate-binding domain-containing protein [Candidatus Terasakiella magnetica]SCA57353.1 exported hypothetical protein [Candidatus Terasakiella magnetica]
MSKKTTFFFLVNLLLFLCLKAPTGQAKDITVGIPHNPPLVFRDGDRAGGIIPTIAIKALKKMGHRVVFRSMPFGRMYKWLHSGKIDVALSVLATPQRQKNAHYSDPILVEKLNIATHTQGKPHDLSGFAKHGICGIIGFSYPTLIFTPQNMILEKDYATCLSSLTKKQVAGVIIGSITGPYIIRNERLDRKVTLLPGAVGFVNIGAALSHKAFSDNDLAEFNHHILTTLQSPEGQALIAPYQ